MLVLQSIEEVKAWRKDRYKAKIGFFPTMGALHEGHLNPIRSLIKQFDEVVVSIFVNPTQFGPKEDFQKYPRTLEHDLNLLREAGVSLVFTPSAQEIYPEGYSTYVEEIQASQPLCGEFRPGHFKGVATVVLKLFHIIEPTTACFGLKDIQQFFVIRKMVVDLNLNVKIVGAETLREADGLAMSSRNRYLNSEDRAKASRLYSELLSISGAPDITPEVLLRSIRKLEEIGFQVQYLELRELPSLSPVFPGKKLELSEKGYVLAAAVFLSGTRLIDNILLGQWKKYQVCDS